MAIRKIIKRATDSLFTNPEFDGTEAARQVKGTTAERASAEAGDMRFNTTLSLMEYYDGTQWKAIDSPPTVSSVSPSTFDTAGDTITVNGSNFQSGLTLTMQASDGTSYTPGTITRVSDTEITFEITSGIVADEADPFDIIITNPSGLSITSSNSLTVQGTLSATTSAGSLGTITDLFRSSLSYDLSVTDSTSESDVTFTYAATSGTLPSGLSLNSSTGALTGTADAVGSDTTYNFTITATGSDASDSTYAETLATAYSLTVNAPVITSYTSVGSGTFSVPSGISAVDVLVVAGGAASGVDNGGGGGAGGLIYRPAFPVTPGSSVSYTVGGGGSSPTGPHPNNTPASGDGSNSVFGTLTAIGGGRGGSWNATDISGKNGGSGGGAARYNDVYNSGIGQAQQPSQPGDSGTYGFGNPGGAAAYSNPHPSGGSGAGGGGAGGAGTSGPGNPAGVGGAGKAYSISGSSVTYAYGGGGGAQSNTNGANGIGQSDNGTNGLAAQANRGGGGSAGSGGGGEQPGNGGSGIVIVQY